MTTLAPPPPAAASPSPSPVPRPRPVEPVLRFPAIRADLLPDEVIASRRLAGLKKRLGLGLVALLGLLVLAYGFSWWQTSNARGNLSDAQHATTRLQAQQQTFAPLLKTQQDAAAIETALHQLMVGDVQWTQMLTVLGKAAPHGVTVDSVQATMTAGAAAATNPGQPGIGVLNQTGDQSVGTLAITGTAPDQKSVAAFVDSLAKVKGLAAPFPASVGSQGKGAMQYSVNVLITTQALDGRYATTTSGGK
jgi:Tfp pilus assembly protein PilN